MVGKPPRRPSPPFRDPAKTRRTVHSEHKAATVADLPTLQTTQKRLRGTYVDTKHASRQEEKRKRSAEVERALREARGNETQEATIRRRAEREEAKHKVRAFFTAPAILSPSSVAMPPCFLGRSFPLDVTGKGVRTVTEPAECRTVLVGVVAAWNPSLTLLIFDHTIWSEHRIRGTFHSGATYDAGSGEAGELSVVSLGRRFCLPGSVSPGFMPTVERDC